MLARTWERPMETIPEPNLWKKKPDHKVTWPEDKYAWSQTATQINKQLFIQPFPHISKEGLSFSCTSVHRLLSHLKNTFSPVVIMTQCMIIADRGVKRDTVYWGALIFSPQKIGPTSLWRGLEGMEYHDEDEHPLEAHPDQLHGCCCGTDLQSRGPEGSQRFYSPGHFQMMSSWQHWYAGEKGILISNLTNHTIYNLN